MYFDPKPKTEKKDLFGLDYLLKSLLDAFSDDTTRMVIIKGLRRTGKTSLLNVALKESKLISVKIDVRESPYYEKKEFLKFLITVIKQKAGSLIEKIIRKISGVKFSCKDFSTSLFFAKEENIALFFANLDKQLTKKNKKIILAFDEAQLLKEIDFDYFLASIFDNYKQIKLLLTGSEIGLLDKFLGKKEYQAPLFNRAYLEIELKRIKEEEITKFLEEGFRQINKKISFNETREVVEHLDGIIGWITHYGWLRYKGLSHEKAIERVKEEGKEIVKKEFERFLETRKAKEKYIKILKYLAAGENSWKILKYNFEKGGVKMSDSQLNLYLKELFDYGFIEKIEEKYFVSDPILLKTIKE